MTPASRNPPSPPMRPPPAESRAPSDLFLLSREAAYLRVLDQVRRYARTATMPVVLEGESGTGKTLFARYLHACSPRAQQPFVTVNLAALDDSLAGSELFGHTTGAFTGAIRARRGSFALADRGTLFLDEIGRASGAVQGKLLHAVEDGVFRPLGADLESVLDVRCIAASSRPLRALVAEDRFLLDLWMRLGALTIRIPSLRERAADIPLLVMAFVGEASVHHGYAQPPTVDNDLMACLRQAPWPGNVRQLAMGVEAMLAMADGAARLTLAHCDPLLLERPKVGNTGPAESAAERAAPNQLRIQLALALERGNKARAARRLGIARGTLYRWLESVPQPALHAE